MATQIQSLEQAFQALADGTRLRILGLLLGGELCVCRLSDFGPPQLSNLQPPLTECSNHQQP